MNVCRVDLCNQQPYQEIEHNQCEVFFFPSPTPHMWWCFRTISPALRHQLGVLQFNSLNSPELASRSTVLRDQSHKTSLISCASCKYPVPMLPTLLSELATKSGVLTPPHPPFDSLLEQRKELKKVLYLTITGLL